MSATYIYNHRLRKHDLWRSLLAIIVIVIILVTAWMLWKHYQHQAPVIEGATVYVPQNIKAQPLQVISEPLFTTQLPADWRETAAGSQIYSWQATLKGNDNRYLSIYIDKIPSTPVNYELPVTTNGNQLMYGSLSDNCAEFTPGGTLDTAQAEKLKPTPSVWQGVNFVCNLPQVVDDQVGTGSVNSPINTVAITGPTGGTHSYFFLYIDRNAQPDYSILYQAIQTFRAK